MDTITRNRCFLKVVEAGGFSAAARDMGRSKALVSKYVSELEDELGVRLLNRTTRQVSLTEVGEAYAREVGELLQRFEELQVSVAQDHHDVRGRLKVSAPRSMAESPLIEAMIDFVKINPLVQLDLQLDDRLVDIVEEGFDVAFRVTDLADSSLIARKIQSVRNIVCASPDYLAHYGVPMQPQDLNGMPCIIDRNSVFKANWHFMVDGQRTSIGVNGPIAVNSAETAKRAALQGVGLIHLPALFLHKELEDGRLQMVLEDYMVPGPGIYAIYPHRRHLSAKVRALVDHVVAYYKELIKRGNCPRLLLE
ncbi:LysR family transcriptional regulator [Polycladidibacter stylochi]|uniref:LysR family transcriptional regulator n=1 Tax=Polycladidibacter stylochi TaxID=1807766 RepID=UPI00082A74D0|nr:LysR family transcriptional regulator [Pseudovibrio stylochi]